MNAANETNLLTNVVERRKSNYKQRVVSNNDGNVDEETNDDEQTIPIETEETEIEKEREMIDDNDNTQMDDDDDDGGIEPENNDELIPIVSTCGSITYQSDSGDEQQYSLNLPNVTNVKIVKVVPLPHARSEVWSYFGFIADDDGEIQDKKKAICKICASTLAYSGNTTNLFTHLKALHPEVNPQKLAPTNRSPRTGRKLGKRKFFDFNSENEIKINENQGKSNTQQYIIRAISYPAASNNNSSTNNDSNDTYQDEVITTESKVHLVKANVKTSTASQNTCSNNSSVEEILANESAEASANLNSFGNNITDTTINSSSSSLITTDHVTNSIVNMLVTDCRPISVVEGKGFEEFIRLLVPAYKIPDSERLKVLVKKKYDDVRRDLILRAMDEE